MRVVAALAVMLALAGCDDGRTDHQSVETTTSIATTTTTTPVTTSHAEPSTTEPVEEPEDGSESIGVTDEVTIVITDPDE